MCDRSFAPENPHPAPGLGAVCFALFAAATSMSCVFAILPSMGRDLGLSETQLGWVVAPAALVFVAFGPVWGSLGRRWSPRAVFATTLTLVAVFTLLFAHAMAWRLAGSISALSCFGLLLASRLLLSPFSAAMLPSAQAFIAQTREGASRSQALAAMGASFALGMVASPGLAAAAVSVGLLAPFYVVATMLLLAAGLSWCKLPAVHAPARPAMRQRQAHTAWRQLAAPLAVLVLLYTIYGILMQVTGFRLQDELGLDAAATTQHAGAALMATAAALVATQMVLARLAIVALAVQRRIALGAAGVGLLSLVALLLPGSYALYVCAMAGFGLSLGTFLPFMLSLLTQRAEAAGDQSRVGGLSAAAQGMGMVLGPLLGAWGYRFDLRMPYAWTCLAMVLACSLYAHTTQARATPA